MLSEGFFFILIIPPFLFVHSSRDFRTFQNFFFVLKEFPSLDFFPTFVIVDTYRSIPVAALIHRFFDRKILEKYGRRRQHGTWTWTSQQG